MQLKENKTTTKLTKQDLQKIIGGKLAGINQHNRFCCKVLNKVDCNK